MWLGLVIVKRVAEYRGALGVLLVLGIAKYGILSCRNYCTNYDAYDI